MHLPSEYIKKVVAVSLNHHFQDTSLHEIFQSAYEKDNSTDTVLTQVHNDIVRALDDGGCVILVLLDLSAAWHSHY